MAAAIIPLIASALPLLTPLIEKGAMALEHLFGAGTGPTKFDTLLKMLLPVVGQLATAGKLNGPIDETTLASMIQTVVSNLKGQGILNPQTAAVVAAQPVSSAVAPSGTFKISGGNLQLIFGQ